MTTDSFDAFWARERDDLVRVLAVSLGDADLAAEAVDEAMVRACARWGRVGGMDRPAAWVLRVARNWATSRWRWRARRPTLSAEQLDRQHDEVMPDLDLRDGLAALSADHRLVLALRFHLDWSVAQISEATGVAEGTVKSRIHRALAAAREELAPATEETS